VLHDKLVPHHDSQFFEQPGNAVLRVDRIGWLRRLFDLACAEYDRLDLDAPTRSARSRRVRARCRGVTEREARARLVKIERLLADLAKGRKLYGHLHDDALKLKYLHQRYSNYLRWLATRL